MVSLLVTSRFTGKRERKRACRADVYKSMAVPRIMRKPAALVLLSLLAGLTTAAGLRLVWQPSTSPSVVGHRVYRGPSSGNFNWVQPIGNETNFSLTNLPEGTFVFMVTAVDGIGLESLPSNEVGLTNRRPAAPRLHPP